MAGVLKCMTGNFIAAGSVVSYSCVDKDGAAFTLATSGTQGNCDILDIRGIRTLAVKPVSAGAAITTTTFYGCDTGSGTFVLINDLGSSGVVSTADSVWSVIDTTKLAPHRFIQMKCDQTGTIKVTAKN